MSTAADDRGFHGRIPPQNLEAEMSVLGSVLLSPQAMDEVATVITAEHFYADRHQKIFAVISERYQAGNRGIDAVTIAEELDRKQQLAGIGGVDYLRQILETVPSSANAAYYAKIVRERWLSRQLIYTCTEIVTSGYECSDSTELLASAETKILSISDEQVSPTTSISEILIEAMNRLQTRSANRGQFSGLRTGFDDLDEKTGGMQGGQLIVIAARPAMGKTALICGLTRNVSSAGGRVLVFSLEMSRHEMAERLLSLESRVSGHSMRLGETTPADFAILLESCETISQRPITIEDSASITVARMAAMCRRQKRRNGLDLVVIDYLQLVQPEDRKTHREQQVAQMTRSLKILAKELDVPVIVLAQLNREVEHRDNKRPRLSDLRESGAIEQDADMVWFLHRPSQYDPEDRPGEAELIVAKQRNGPGGPSCVVTLAWIQHLMRFDNFATNHAHQHTQTPLFA